MEDLGSVFILVLTSLVGLVLIPFGLPGLWVIVLGIVGYGWLTDFRTLSAGSMRLRRRLPFISTSSAGRGQEQ